MKLFAYPNHNWLTEALCAAALTLLLAPAQAAVPPHPVWERISQPLYPPSAVARAIEGELLVEYSVDPKGKVVDARVIRANPERIFDESVLGEMKRWRYKKMSGGTEEAAKGPLSIAFEFQLAPCAAPQALVIADPTTGPSGAVAYSSGFESIHICVGSTDGKGPRRIKSSADADEFFMKGQLRERKEMGTDLFSAQIAPRK